MKAKQRKLCFNNENRSEMHKYYISIKNKNKTPQHLLRRGKSMSSFNLQNVQSIYSKPKDDTFFNDTLLAQSQNNITNFTLVNNPLNIFLSKERNAFSLYPSKTNNIQPIIPPKTEEFYNKKTLILDLDETIVHSGFTQYNPNIPSDIILNIELERQTKDIHILIRPGVDEFLKRMSRRFEIIIFTASLSKYADPLIDILDKEKCVSHRLFRSECTYINGAFIKDLKRLNRNLKDVIIVDNSPIAYILHPENGLPIKTWYDDKDDRELFNIAPVIEFLSYVEDVRNFIPKLVIDNEVSLGKAMIIISDYNEQLKAQQINQQQEEKKKINSKIVNNNTNYIYNNENNNEEINNSKIQNDNSINKNKTNSSFINNNFRQSLKKGRGVKEGSKEESSINKRNSILLIKSKGIGNTRKIPIPKNMKTQNKLIPNKTDRYNGYHKYFTNRLNFNKRVSSSQNKNYNNNNKENIGYSKDNKVKKKKNFIKKSVSMNKLLFHTCPNNTLNTNTNTINAIANKKNISSLFSRKNYINKRNVSYDAIDIKRPMTARVRTSNKIIFKTTSNSNINSKVPLSNNNIGSNNDILKHLHNRPKSYSELNKCPLE